jgi:ribosome recycling factor
MEDIVQQAQNEFTKIMDFLRSEFSRLQIGRASAALVEGLMVEAYGSRQSLKGMASISVPDAKTVQIQPWDKSVLSAIEKAVQNSDLNLTPVNDGVTIRLNLPPLTEERRRDLTKVVHRMAEESRISVRNARQKALDKAKEMEKNGELTEDQMKMFQKKLQDKVDAVNLDIEKTSKTKENDVMTV